jgi:hypothetical protein
MRITDLLFAALLASTPAVTASKVLEPAPQPPASAPVLPPKIQKPSTPKVEVLFLLDTTGSMGGLIQGAKEKIWSIANEIASAQPKPEIRMGLVAYRDRGDAYVTKVVDLNSDIDQVYEELLALRAGGGGDGPEHVLKALADASQKISWDDDPSAFRVAYLVGDAPAHLDYGDTPGLENLSKALVAKGVILNTIQCGQDGRTTAQWRRIARLGDGTFLSIAQNGGVVSIDTPFDAEISRLNRELDATMLGYGAGRAASESKKDRARRLAASAPASAAAERAAFKAVRGFAAEDDFVAALEEGEASLDSQEAPEALRTLPAKQRREKIAAIQDKRRELRSRIGALSQNRAAYIKKERADKGGSERESFDAKLVESLKSQAAAKGLRY